MRVLVFDFDDTLFPTTYIKKNISDEKIFEEVKNELKNTIRLLERAKLNSNKVYIISNANLIWIDECINRFLPEYKEIFSNVKIICTKNNIYYDNLAIHQKKRDCFFDEFSKLFCDEDNHEFITFGDSEYDTSASENIRFLFSNVTVKIVIFKELPNLKELVIQQDFVLKNMELFENFPKNCNFLLTKKLLI